MSFTTASPLVLIGSRSASRGAKIEHIITEDGRLALLGVHTKRESLIRAIVASPAASLILDATLADATAIDVVYQVLLHRPCHIVIIGDLGGEICTAIRAGVLDCIAWSPFPQSVLAAADHLVEAAAFAPQLRPRLEPPLPRKEPVRAQQRQDSQQLLLLLGKHRASSLCEALSVLPAHFPAAVLCHDPVHHTTRAQLGTELSAFSSLRVTTSNTAKVQNSAAYLLDRRSGLVIDKVGAEDKVRIEVLPGMPLSVGESLAWLNPLKRETRSAALGVIAVIHGGMSTDNQADIAQMAAAGAVLARRHKEGYQLKWPHVAHPLMLSPHTFWEHIAEHISRMGHGFMEAQAP